MFDLRAADLRKLNSLTKYPSIPTHHALDKRNGGLLEEPTVFAGPVIGTERVVGINGRVVLLPGGPAHGVGRHRPQPGARDRGCAPRRRGEGRDVRDGRPACRLFDVASIPGDMLAWEVERKAERRRRMRRAAGAEAAS